MLIEAVNFGFRKSRVSASQPDERAPGAARSSGSWNLSSDNVLSWARRLVQASDRAGYDARGATCFRTWGKQLPASGQT